MFTVSLKMLGKNTFEITIVYLKAFASEKKCIQFILYLITINNAMI